jgi:hypothetical protein
VLVTDNLDPGPHHHEVHFYSDDAAFVETVANFVAAALMAGNPAIAFCAKPHRDLLYQSLKLQDVDVDAAIVERVGLRLNSGVTRCVCDGGPAVRGRGGQCRAGADWTVREQD